MTFVGAPGSEYVAACAEGISRETNTATAVASAPKPVNLRDLRVCFIAPSNQRLTAISKGER